MLLKETLAQMLPCEFCEVFKITFFTERLRETTSVKTKKLFHKCFMMIDLEEYINLVIFINLKYNLY